MLRTDECTNKLLIKTYYRIHLGFYRFRDDPYIYGSLGSVINTPSFTMEVCVNGKSTSSINSPSEESRELIRNILKELKLLDKGLTINLSGYLAHHVGLGSRTKIVMTTLKAIQKLLNPRLNLVKTATKFGVAQVSGIGLYTFLRGGFIVDTGLKKFMGKPPIHPKPLVRVLPPKNWRVIIALPEGVRGLREHEERDALDNVVSHPDQNVLYKNLLIVLNSIRSGDFKLFGEAITKIQVLTGRYFSKYQGGIFCCEESEYLANALAKAGALGIGQSSWGPLVYGFVKNDKHALSVTQYLKSLEGTLKFRYWVARVPDVGFEIL